MGCNPTSCGLRQELPYTTRHLTPPRGSGGQPVKKERSVFVRFPPIDFIFPLYLKLRVEQMGWHGKRRRNKVGI